MFLRNFRCLIISARNQSKSFSQVPVKLEDDLKPLLDNISQLNEPPKSLIDPGGASELDEYAPYLAPTFNLAAYANKSPTLKKFLDLGVDLYKIEKRKGLGQFVLGLDFEKHCKDHLTFLNDLGVSPDSFGRFITKNPMFFKESIDDMRVRVNYLESKKFTPAMISRIVATNPYWLMFSTKRIDQRLGYFQKTFSLSGKQVRKLVCLQPKLITYSMEHIEHASFSIKQELGFSEQEIKDLLLQRPKIFMLNHEELLNRFEYAHQKMKLSHDDIIKHSELLLTRQFRLKQRHEFLVKLGRNQYDPKKELYISPSTLVTAPTREFVENLAKSCMEEYDKFRKSL